ncbi:MAG: NIL domain-containing protein [Candidatus Omnitrophota bacterium]|nr:NIL domain-containing protein [Candidatus Omnitrophota bacterium]
MKIQVELTFPAELKDEPILYKIGRDFKVIPNVLEASFSTDMGWVILTLEGSETEVNRLFDYLREKNVTISRR